ncbi:MAG: DNA methyltransferase [Thermomicrobiales bacterium]
MTVSRSPEHALNAICPYFTMFPLSFPLSVLVERAEPGDWVIDPFCGRGTTNFAARLLGLPTVGIDSSPVGAAVAAAKLVSATPRTVLRAAEMILAESPQPIDVPQGEFWEWAYAPEVLHTVCRLREVLLRDAKTPARKALRAVMLGALHGPRTKVLPSYFSNQCPRTYAPKPRYATAFWRERGLRPEVVDVLDIIERRAQRYFARRLPRAKGVIWHGDSRQRASFARLGQRFRWVITSPPYYGMRTYVPDQWLRGWFLGGPPAVDYSQDGQLTHSGRDLFVADLAVVWRRVREVCLPDATMVVRFGAIHDRAAPALDLLAASLTASGWAIAEIVPAGSARDGRRQADHFARNRAAAIAEHDVWAVRHD